MKKPPLCEITWLDAIERDVSCKLSEAAADKYARLYERHTSGYLVRDDADVVVIAREFDPAEPDDEEATIGKFLTIPRGWVKAIKPVRGKRKLKEPKND